jgi:hypothetical protein
MEELIERVSAILDSPVLHYTKHKTYRQISILFLVYLLFFSSLVLAQEENAKFKPFERKPISKIENIQKAGKKYVKPSNTMKSIKKSSEAMKEVENLFNNLELSIKELADIKTDNETDEKSILKTFAELDGILSYAYTQMKEGKEQLSSIRPETQEEITEFNSLKVKFMSYMRLANDLKIIIAEKLASASKKDTK